MTALGTVTYVVMLLFLLESPKWLLLAGNLKEAHKIFGDIARINGSTTKIPEDAIFLEYLISGHSKRFRSDSDQIKESLRS